VGLGQPGGARTGARALAESLRRAVAEVAPDLAVDDVGTGASSLNNSSGTSCSSVRSLVAFALLGLVLAAVGLYSVISHTVAQRAGEFGIRLALAPSRPMCSSSCSTRTPARGARSRHWSRRRLWSRALPQRPNAPPRRGGPRRASRSFGHLLVVALIACGLPARRATKVDPWSFFARVAGRQVVSVVYDLHCYGQAIMPPRPYRTSRPLVGRGLAGCA